MASRSWNRVELIGNLTRDPELRYTPNGAAVSTFGVATNRVYMVEGEKKEDVDFHKIVAWNKLAELCNQLLKKGSRVFISGRLQYREWEGQDGQKRRDTEIVLEDMILLTPKGEASGEEFVRTAEVTEAFAAPADSGSTASESTEEKPTDKSEEKPEIEEKPAEARKPEEKVEDDLPF